MARTKPSALSAGTIGDDMSDVIQGIAEILDAYDKSYTYDITDQQKDMCQGMAFGIRSSVIFEASRAITRHIFEENGAYEGVPMDELRMPVDARVPAELCVLYMTHSERGLFIKRDVAGVMSGAVHPTVSVLTVGKDVIPTYHGYYEISDKEEENRLFIPKDSVESYKENTTHINTLLTVGMFFSLVNQPRFVVRRAAGSRPARKRMAKSHGIPTDSWHKIEWNLNKPRVEVGEKLGGGWNMPLHYKRGHWRKAQEHWEDVVIRKDGNPYKWIEGYWAGHPAYGTKKSYYAPKLGGKYETIHA